MAQIHKWRVVVIMAHDGETYFEYNDLEQSILDQSKFENLSYIIFYYNQKYDKFSIKSPGIDDKKRYLQELPETSQFAGKDFYDPDTLTQFLQYVKSADTDNDTVYHYFVITWAHGGGLFYFPSDKIPDLIKRLGPSVEKDNKLIGSIHTTFQEEVGAFAQICSDISFKDKHWLQTPPYPFLTVDLFKDTAHFAEKDDKDRIAAILNEFNTSVNDSIKYYTATELNEIFSKGIGYIDVYFALNCYTQMIETGYELRHSVNMMVASQTTMPISGINYTEVFAALEQNPAVSLKELSDIITTSFDCKYTSAFEKIIKSHYPDFEIKPVSFACNFLANYQQLVQSLDQLTEFIEATYDDPALKPIKKLVADARRSCIDLTPDHNYGIIDLNNFLIQLQIELPDEFRKDITHIKDQFECIRNCVRAGIKLPDVTVEATSGNPLFLSFFAPAGRGSKYIDFLLQIYLHMNNEFSSASKWAKFAYTFYFYFPAS